jgi:hypothetical protein
VIFQFALLEQLSKMQLHIGQIHHISSQLTQVGKRNIFPEVCLVFPPPVNLVQGGGIFIPTPFILHQYSKPSIQYSSFTPEANRVGWVVSM